MAAPTGAVLKPAGVARADPTFISEEVFLVEKRFELCAGIE